MNAYLKLQEALVNYINETIKVDGHDPNFYNLEKIAVEIESEISDSLEMMLEEQYQINIINEAI